MPRMPGKRKATPKRRRPTPPGRGEFSPGEPRRTTAPRYKKDVKVSKYKPRPRRK